MNDVHDFVESLEAEINQHVNNFISQYPDLSNEEIIVIMDSLDFNQYQPLDDFENYLDHTSLRSKIDVDMYDYLQTSKENFEWLVSPDNHIIQDDIIRTILNTDVAVKIGDSTYVIIDNGWVSFSEEAIYVKEVEDIKNGDFIGPYKKHTPVNPVPQPNPSCSDCKTSKKVIGGVDVSNKRMTAILSVKTFPWGGKVVAKTNSYKKGWTGIYGLKRTVNFARINSGSIVYNGSCNTTLSVFDEDEDYGWNAKASYYKGGFVMKTKCNKVSSLHNSFNYSMVQTLTLYW